MPRMSDKQSFCYMPCFLMNYRSYSSFNKRKKLAGRGTTQSFRIRLYYFVMVVVA